MKKKYSKSGAALLIVLLFIALVSAMAFTIGRQMLSEFILSINAGNSTAAYYAAEAGLEDGLLRYKLDRNYQTTWDDQEGKNLPEEPIALDAKTKYQLTMGYLDNKLEIPINFNKDKSQTRDLIVKGTQTITLNMPCSGSVIGWEITPFDAMNSINYSEQRYYKCPFSETYNLDLQNIVKVRVKVFIEGSDPNAFATLMINNPEFALIDSGITTITSVGFVGKNVRKLELQIDRATGATIGFLDYALYAGGDVPGGSIK